VIGAVLGFLFLPRLTGTGAAAALGGAIAIGVVSSVVGWLAGRGRGAVSGLVAGAVAGSFLGFLIGGIPWTWPPAVGFAITIGLIAWPIINFALAWPKLDIGERFSRLYPKQTIETVTETREWLENQVQSRLPTRGKK
jgi:MFS family permease